MMGDQCKYSRKPSDVTLAEAVLLSVRARAEARRKEEASSRIEALQNAAVVESEALAEHQATLAQSNTQPQDEATILQHHLKLFRVSCRSLRQQLGRFPFVAHLIAPRLVFL